MWTRRWSSANIWEVTSDKNKIYIISIQTISQQQLTVELLQKFRESFHIIQRRWFVYKRSWMPPINDYLHCENFRELSLTALAARQLRAEPASEGGAVLPVVPGGRERAGAGLQHWQPQGEVRLRDEEGNITSSTTTTIREIQKQELQQREILRSGRSKPVDTLAWH